MAENTKDPKNITTESSRGVPLEKVEQLMNKRLQDAKIEADKQIQGALVAVFGIFASIISFLTVEFQFLKTLNNLQQIVGFSLILFALLLGFNIALDYLTKSRLDNGISTQYKYFIAIISGIFIIGLISVYFGNDKFTKQKKINKKERYLIANKLNDLQLRCDQKIEICNKSIQLFEKSILKDIEVLNMRIKLLEK